MPNLGTPLLVYVNHLLAMCQLGKPRKIFLSRLKLVKVKNVNRLKSKGYLLC